MYKNRVAASALGVYLLFQLTHEPLAESVVPGFHSVVLAPYALAGIIADLWLIFWVIMYAVPGKNKHLRGAVSLTHVVLSLSLLFLINLTNSSIAIPIMYFVFLSVQLFYTAKLWRMAKRS